EQEVLHRLLPEIVVDAEDRRLVEDAMERRVQGPGRGQVAAERLLQDDPRALRAPGLAETLDDRREEARRDREVVERPLRVAERLAERGVGLLVLVAAADEA